MAKKHKTSFEEFYSDIYGDRWPALKEALLADRVHMSPDGLLRSYYMDPASAAAARALAVEAGDTVLDMCAAPGGKTLLLALALGGTGSLTSNDRSADRRRRLRNVIDDHLPPGLRENISVTGHDSTRWGLFEKDVYDRVLLDAPCSSEEHVLKSPAHLKKWSPARTKQLAVQAHAMLAAAVDAVKPGGTIIYSTCSLSPLENDGVVEKLLKKRSEIIEVSDPGVDSSAETGEPTRFGRHILPDTAGGCGPIYYVKIVKKTVAGLTEEA